MLFGLSRFGQAETPLALLVQMAHGLGAVLLLLVIAYGRSGLLVRWSEGQQPREVWKRRPLGLVAPALVLSAVAALLLRGAGYFNLSAFLVRSVPLTALVLMASCMAYRLFLPWLMGLAEWPARCLEGWAPYAATAFRLLRGTLIVTVGVLSAAVLVGIWGRFSAAGRIVDALLYVAAGSGLGGLAGTALLPWLLRPLRWLGGAWNEALVQLLSVPVAVYGLLLGIYRGVLALIPTAGSHWAERPFRSAMIVLITYTLIRVSSGKGLRSPTPCGT